MNDDIQRMQRTILSAVVGSVVMAGAFLISFNIQANRLIESVDDLNRSFNQANEDFCADTIIEEFGYVEFPDDSDAGI